MENIIHNSPSTPQGGSDLSAQGARVAEIEALINKDSIPEGFEVDDDGVWHLSQPKPNAPLERTWLSSPLWVTAITRDREGENFGRRLEFPDIDGKTHYWTMPMEMLGSESSRVIAVLLNKGLRISHRKSERDRLLEYVSLSEPVRKARCVLQCGWFKNAFVLPDQTIGYIQSENIFFQNPSGIEMSSESSGSLDDWKQNVARRARGNSRLILAISAAFAAPTLRLMNHENFGVHFRGNSSLGKSTAAYVGNSVWASPAGIHSFRATANGLEGIASLHNDRLLSLDELGQIAPLEAGQVIYMLGNGAGKGRGSGSGLPRKSSAWRIVFISTGEIALNQLMNEVGKKTKAGQEVRLIEIPADTNVYGLFENVHGDGNGAQFSNCLRDACREYYGTAARAFLQKLVEDPDGAVGTMKGIMDGLKQRYLPLGASAQVIRVFNHLALIAASGELASQYGITGWDVEESIDGVMKCFEDWLRARGDIGMHEEKEALSQVKNFFEQHGESRFTPCGQDEKIRTHNRAGFRRNSDGGIEFYVFVESFRNEICKGLDYRYVEKICIREGLLMPSADGSPTRSERLPDIKGTKRFYRFRPIVLGDGEGA